MNIKTPENSQKFKLIRTKNQPNVKENQTKKFIL